MLFLFSKSDTVSLPIRPPCIRRADTEVIKIWNLVIRVDAQAPALPLIGIDQVIHDLSAELAGTEIDDIAVLVQLHLELEAVDADDGMRGLVEEESVESQLVSIDHLQIRRDIVDIGCRVDFFLCC